jgi:hypothetical protein
MQLFAVFETPALYPRGQTGIQIGRPSNMVVVAYADNVTIFLTSDDIRTIQDAIRCYEAASGARLNVEKSKAMTIGSWVTSTGIMAFRTIRKCGS